MTDRISDYEVDYLGNIIEILPRPRTSYPPISTQSLKSLPLHELDNDLLILDDEIEINEEGQEITYCVNK